MDNFQLEELHRLRALMEQLNKRCLEAETANDRIREELREARLCITMLLESAKTLQEFSAETGGSPWVHVGGIPS